MDKKYIFSDYNNYIQDEYSYCREERQYALFLHNILMKHKYDSNFAKDLIEAVGFADDEIVDLFYEATFMRDSFHRDRRCAYDDNPEIDLLNKKCKDEGNIDKLKVSCKERFNYKLISYVEKIIGGFGNMGEESFLDFIVEAECSKVKKSSKEYAIWDVNLGGQEGIGRMNEYKDKYLDRFRQYILGRDIGKDDVERALVDCRLRTEAVFNYAKVMMNSKPDIAVFVKGKSDTSDNTVTMKLLECKFEASEDVYRDLMYDPNAGKPEHIRQLFVQNLVAEFLCGRDEDRKFWPGVFAGNVKYKKMSKDDIIYFVRKEESTAHKKIQLNIKDLIDIHNECFK